MLFLGLLAGQRSANELEAQSLALQREVAIRVEREITSFITTRVNELRVFERTNDLAEAGADDLLADVRRLMAHDQVYQEIAVLSAMGEIGIFSSRTTTLPSDPEHWRDERFVSPGYWDQNDVFVGTIEYHDALREPLVDIGLPIHVRRDGSIRGILLAHVRFRPIWELLADLELPKDTVAFVVDEGGRVLAHPSPAEVLSNSVFELPGANGRHPLADGTEGLVAVDALDLVGGAAYVVVTRPLNAALATARDARFNTFLSAAILLVIGSLVALMQSNRIVRPIERLARTAERISAGDLNTRIDVSGPREIQALGTTLQDMVSRLGARIGDLTRSEDALRQRAAVMLESIGDAVIATDINGRITYINPVAETLTGWSLSDAIDQPLPAVFRIVNEATREAAPNPVEKCLATGHMVDLTNGSLLFSRDGQEYPINDSAAPIREASGEVVGAVIVFRDVGEQRAMEQSLRQSQKLDAIGKLSGGIAHDFNNLMQVIQGNAELLQEDPSLDPQLTKPILDATRRGAELTRQLLSYARKQPLLTKPISVPKLLQQTTQVLDRTLGAGVEVSLEIEDDIWLARADPYHLEAALLNLALNARDAMPGGGTLAITCKNAVGADFADAHDKTLADAPFVAITVSDSGTGMAPEVLERATDPFFTTKAVGSGSGMGLSMVYGFALQSDGHMQIDSKEGTGTTVTLFLPRFEQPSTAARPAKGAPARPDNRKTVLVVEDSREVRTLTIRILETSGYHVVSAKNVQDAKRILDDHPAIDLVLSDVMLPGGKSGLDLACELGETRPELPVVLISGYPNAVEKLQGASRDDLVLLNKPFQKADLIATLENVLRQKPRATASKDALQSMG
ncbi:MAG: PAS domain-containing protein [Paracoccaceae bacterium]|nr:PAS domain-containing protein [Paracoccaceae bacterium]